MRTSLLFLVFSLVSRFTLARDITAVQSGKWESPQTWNCRCVPSNTDNITIPENVTVKSDGAILLNFGPAIVLMIDGTLELQPAALFMDPEDFIAIGAGGKIEAGSNGTTLYAGKLPFFVSAREPMTGPATIFAGALPPSLSYFDAQQDSSDVCLKWSRSNGIEEFLFTLQRSADGIHFENISGIYGGNDPKQKADCVFFDAHPFAGMTYYRLLQSKDNVLIAAVTRLYVQEKPGKRTF